MAQLNRNDIVSMIKQRQRSILIEMAAERYGLDGAVILLGYNERYAELNGLLDAIEDGEAE